jgi:hypothetical protein
MRVKVVFDRADSATGTALSNQFGAPNEDTGDTDPTIRGATPGLGPQRTFTWNAMDKPTVELLVRFGWDRTAIRNINLEK